MRKGGEAQKRDRSMPLPPERVRARGLHGELHSATRRTIEGLTALEINVGVVEIIEAAKESVKTGRAVPLPLKK